MLCRRKILIILQDKKVVLVRIYFNGLFCNYKYNKTLYVNCRMRYFRFRITRTFFATTFKFKIFSAVPQIFNYRDNSPNMSKFDYLNRVNTHVL